MDKQLPIGFHHGIPFADYQAIDAVNWSLLKSYDISPMQARHDMLQPPDATDQQIFGQAFHCAVGEPERFLADYLTMPRFDGHPNSTAYKTAKQQWIDQNKTKVHLAADEYESLTQMQRNVLAHPVAGAIARAKGRNEITLVWENPGYKLRCKARLDRLCRIPTRLLFPTAGVPDDDEAIVLCDWKTTKAHWPGNHGFDGEMARYKYQGQCAWYHDGLQIVKPASVVVVIVAVQNVAPFDVVVYRIDPEVLEQGRKLYRRLLGLHAKCVAGKAWPGVSSQIIPAVLPKWAEEPSAE